MTVIEVLSANAIPFEQKEQDNLYIDCPDCGKLNISVNMFSGVWHCWNSDCEERGSRGSFPSLLQKLGIPAQGIELTTSPPPKKDRTLSEEDARAIINSNTNKAEVIEWASSRALDPTFVIKQGVGYDPKSKAIVFPFRDPKGKLVGARYRGLNGDFWAKGQEPDLYILDPADLHKTKIIIVEGEVDALTLKMFALPVVATLGASKDKGFHLLANHRQILLGYDMDKAGETGVQKATQALGRYRCKRVTWGLKDPNDMLKAGQGKDEILACLLSATPLADIKSRSVAQTIKDWSAQSKSESRKRYSWGYPRLDSFTDGIGGGMYVGILAEAGTGKTTFMINAARNLAHQGAGVGIASLEEHAINEITPKVTATVVGRNPGSGDFTEAEIKKAEKEINRIHLYEGDEEVEPLIDWIKECYYMHDVKFVFIDYLQWLVPDEKDVELLKRIGKQFKKLVKQMPDLFIGMIIQPKQKQKTTDKNGQPVRQKLDGSDARGGATINQSVDAMLTIKGVDGHPNITQFEYTKVRGHLRVSKRQWLNEFTQLEYDHGTLRQIEVNQSNIIYGG